MTNNTQNQIKIALYPGYSVPFGFLRPANCCPWGLGRTRAWYITKAPMNLSARIIKAACPPGSAHTQIGRRIAAEQRGTACAAALVSTGSSCWVRCRAHWSVGRRRHKALLPSEQPAAGPPRPFGIDAILWSSPRTCPFSAMRAAFKSTASLDLPARRLECVGDGRQFPRTRVLVILGPHFLERFGPFWPGGPDWRFPPPSRGFPFVACSHRRGFFPLE